MKLSLRAQNFIAVLSSNFGVQGLRFLTITVLARRLGTDLFGTYNYIILLVTYGFVLVEFGLKNLAIREFAQGRGSRALVGRIIRIRLALAVFAALAVVGLTHATFLNTGFFWPSALIGGSLLADALLVDFILVAREKLLPQSLGSLAQAFLLFLGCYLYVHSAEDFLLVGVFYFLSHILWATFLAVASRPLAGPDEKPAPSGAKIWHTAVSGMPFLVAALLFGIATSMDLLLLGQFHYSSWLGVYSAAMKIIGIALGVVQSLVASVQPRLAKESSDVHSREMRELISWTTRFLWIFVAPTLAGCWLFGPPLVQWLFGPAYTEAAALLKPLSVSFGFVALSLCPLNTLWVSHHARPVMAIGIFHCVAALLGVGIPCLMNRPDLVAWGMTAAQGAFLIAVWGWFRSKAILTLEDFRFLPVPLALLAAPLLASGPAPLRFALATAGYLAGLAFMKLWKQHWFTNILGSVNK